MSRRYEELKPYAVMWRPDLVTGWVMLASSDLREDADTEAEEALKKWGGQARIISQHVIEVKPGRHRVARRAANYRELIERAHRKADAARR